MPSMTSCGGLKVLSTSSTSVSYVTSDFLSFANEKLTERPTSGRIRRKKEEASFALECRILTLIRGERSESAGV